MSNEKRVKLGGGNACAEVALLAVPAILSMLVVGMYAICDTYFLSLAGSVAVGGVCYPVSAVAQGVCMTFAFGSANSISQSLGKGEKDECKEYFSSGLMSVVVVAVLLGGLVGVFSTQIVDFCSGGVSVFGSGVFLFVQGLGLWVFAIYFYFSACIRAEGGGAAVMIASVLGLCCNFIFNFLSVKVFDFGVFGIAISTCAAQGFGAMFLIAWGFFKSEIAKMRLKLFDIFCVFDIVTLGSSSFFRQLMAGISAIALNFVCGKLGGETIAACTIAAKVSVLLFSFGLGVGQGMQPVLAFYFGAGTLSQARKALILTLILGCGLGIVVGALQFAFASEIAMLFGGENHAAAIIAGEILKVSAMSVVFSYLLVIINMSFQAVGQKWMNIAISTLRQGVVFIPTLLILSSAFGKSGVVWAHFASDTIAFVVAVVCVLPLLCGEKLKS